MKERWGNKTLRGKPGVWMGWLPKLHAIQRPSARRHSKTNPAPPERDLKYERLADIATLGKAQNFTERFREIISDPLNLLIERVPEAGYVDAEGRVVLHNGIRVPIAGPGAYYGAFSEIFLLNRGVHEPLEEYCFQQLLQHLQNVGGPQTLLELGAYWGHYSMWFCQSLPQARCVLVEPEAHHLEVGRANFRINGLQGEFIQQHVGPGGFSVDNYLFESPRIGSALTVLHADIQGQELHMLADSSRALSEGQVKYLMVSTHGATLHERCCEEIARHRYCIEISSEPNLHTTSHDGFIFASRADLPTVMDVEEILGREQIAHSSPSRLLTYLNTFPQRD